jgi:RNA polymerase sigma factor (sigma-70 family)
MALVASEWVITRGQDAAFEALFSAKYSTVVAIAFRVLADAHEAEDIAQDVFCQFYRHHSPDVPWAGAWLHRAAVHAALNHIRRTKRRARRESQEAIERDRFQSSATVALDPQAAFEQSERCREVRAALASMPHKSATVLALRYSGLSYGEVAAALDVGVGQVGTLLRRAEAALRKEMKRETPQ